MERVESSERSVAVNGMMWVRMLTGAIRLNGGVEKLANSRFPQQFATSLEAGGFVTTAPPFFQDFMRQSDVPNAEGSANSCASESFRSG